MLNLYKGFQSGKAFKQMASNGLKHAALRFREKYLNLLSHGGVLILHIWEHFIRNRSPPTPPPQQISCLEDFFCFGYYRHGWGQKYSNRTPSQRFQLAPPDYMMLPCTSTSMYPLANSDITSGSLVLKFNNFFKQRIASRRELATLGYREKHPNLLSHGGVLFRLKATAVTIPILKSFYILSTAGMEERFLSREIFNWHTVYSKQGWEFDLPFFERTSDLLRKKERFNLF